MEEDNVQIYGKYVFFQAAKKRLWDTLLELTTAAVLVKLF